ncbi:hypothetical protein [Cryptosporangium arvum]|uniref:hypothetical protein n=1 Tax=Cryptosporangium arvum TaxID=80871 RepID=UPI0004AE5FBB|nr:hypothetical protein [Cryptosporangium arvum]
MATTSAPPAAAVPVAVRASAVAWHGGHVTLSVLVVKLYELFLATTGRPSTRVTVLSDQLRTLRVIETGPASAPRSTG